MRPSLNLFPKVAKEILFKPRFLPSVDFFFPFTSNQCGISGMGWYNMINLPQVGSLNCMVHKKLKKTVSNVKANVNFQLLLCKRLNTMSMYVDDLTYYQ